MSHSRHGSRTIFEKIEIPLKPASVAAHKQIPSNFKSTIEKEYATKYLEKIGVTPTQENIEFILSNLPIKDALVIPAWTRETLLIVPDKAKESEETVLHEIYEKKNAKVLSDLSSNLSKTQPHHKVQSKSVYKLRRIEKLPKGTGQLYEGIPSKYDSIRRISRKTMEKLEIFGPEIHFSHIHQFTKPSFRKLLHPIEVTDENLKAHLAIFNTYLTDHIPQIQSVEHEEVLLERLRSFLEEPLCIRFYGLLVHFAYWNMIHPFARRALKSLQQYTLNTTDTDQNNNIKINNITHNFSNNNNNSNNSNSLMIVIPGKEQQEELLDDLSLKSQRSDDDDLGGSSPSRPVTVGSGPSAVSRVPYREVIKTPEPDYTSGMEDDICYENMSLREVAELRMNKFAALHHDLGVSSGSPHDDSVCEDVKSPLDSRTRSSRNSSPTKSDVDSIDIDADTLASTMTALSLSSDTSLAPGEKEVLYLQLEECLQLLRKQIGFSSSSMHMAHHALLACCHIVVDDILLTTYPWLSTPIDEKKETSIQTNASRSTRLTDLPLHLQLRRIVHHAMSDILDPYRVFAPSLMIPSLGENGVGTTTVAAGMSHSSRADRGRYFATSAAVCALFSGTYSTGDNQSSRGAVAGNEEVRRLLWMSTHQNHRNETKFRKDEDIHDITPGFLQSKSTFPRISTAEGRPRSGTAMGRTRNDWRSSTNCKTNTSNNTSQAAPMQTRTRTKASSSPQLPRSATAPDRNNMSQVDGGLSTLGSYFQNQDRKALNRVSDETETSTEYDFRRSLIDPKNLFESAERAKTAPINKRRMIPGLSSNQGSKVGFESSSQLPKEAEMEIATSFSLTQKELPAVSLKTKSQLMKLMVDKAKHFYSDKNSGHPAHAYRGDLRLKILNMEK